MSAPPLRATYRLQFSKAFRFDDARRIVPYLAALGISHVYASPLMMARPGSTHGYDIVDHNRLNPEIGTRADFDRFVAALHAHDLGLILDFVPNHMGIGPDNPWWRDVLEWGKASPYAGYFDIDWRPVEPTLAGKVLLPVLGDHYGAVLERGELVLEVDADTGSFSVTYFGTPFPVNAASYASLLERAAAQDTGEDRALSALARSFRDALKGRADVRRGARRSRVAELRRAFAQLMTNGGVTRAAVTAALAQMKGTPGKPESFDALHRLLEKQSYRLSFWRVAAHEMNYRRFFDINDLAGLRIEQADLFASSHALIGQLVNGQQLQGLRIDHVDGLRNPREYVERLQTLSDPGWRAGAWRRKNRAGRRRPLPLYVVVEKILAAHESLRKDWPVGGTSGYEFMAAVNGLFVDAGAERFLTRTYTRFIGRDLDFQKMRVEAKRQIMRDTLGSELSVLANLFNRIAKQRRDTRDYSMTGLRQALVDVIANFPVYRTYVTARQTAAEDRRDLDWAIAKARKTSPASDTSVYDFIQGALSLDLLKNASRNYRRGDVIDAAMKFQQYTGPVMAKAIEDTVFYRYVRLVSLNEVGGEPDRFGVSPAAFHEMNRRRAAEHPLSMLATATHDHKRGEDVRARLNVLSEIPALWQQRLRRWATLNRRKRGTADGEPAPYRNDEYLLYQTIVGAWPYDLKSPDFRSIEPFRQRITEYMCKAAREAKMQTSWASPNKAYEGALSQFIAEVLDARSNRPFVEDVSAFVAHIAAAGALNGLAQTVLKLTSPGVADIYQGCEFWDLSLVDPDNRRPVDYETRETHLSGATGPQALVASFADGRVKQHVIRTILGLRAARPGSFAEAFYVTIQPAGRHADRVLSFARLAEGDESMLVVVPRLAWPLLQASDTPLPVGWADTRLELGDTVTARRFVEVLTGRQVEVGGSGKLHIADLLGEFPAAVLASEQSQLFPGVHE